MTQQVVSGNANNRYKKRLFIDTGSRYVEVKAKIIEPYIPPEPIPKSKEHQIISGVSYLSNKGFSSYKAKLRLLFTEKTSYTEYIMWAGGTHKFYDEMGAIYTGVLDSIQRTVYEAGTKYVVDITLTLVKKDEYEQAHRAKFVDLVDEDTGKEYSYADDVHEMADLGLIATSNIDGSPVYYFKGGDYVSRAEFVSFINRTRRWLERVIKE